MFSANATNAAKNTAVTYSKDGTYRFRVTATNALGQSTTSDVSVVVQQKATAFFLTPHAQSVKRGRSLQFLRERSINFTTPCEFSPASPGRLRWAREPSDPLRASLPRGQQKDMW